MVYEKQEFTNGQPLQAAQLNHMEDGIAAATAAVGDVEAALDGILAIQNELIGGEST